VAADRRGLLLTGLSAAVGIAAHNLPEGLVVYNHTIGGICALEAGAAPLQWWQLPADPARCLSRGVAMTLAIALHNIPEGMAVAAPVYAATGSWLRAMQYCALSSLGEPLAAVLFGLVFSGGLTRLAMACVNAFTAGIMVALCLAELMPEAARLAGGPQAALSNLAGQALMCGSILLMRSAGVH
jgi:ZIP family zinc transporter